jgi:hypothetical protein
LRCRWRRWGILPHPIGFLNSCVNGPISKIIQLLFTDCWEFRTKKDSVWAVPHNL